MGLIGGADCQEESQLEAHVLESEAAIDKLYYLEYRLPGNLVGVTVSLNFNRLSSR